MQWPVMQAEDAGEGAGGTASPSEGAASPSAGAEIPSRADTGTQTEGSRSTSLLDWRLGLSDNLKTAGIIQRHATPEAAAQTLIEQDQTLSRALILPDRRKAPAGSPEYEAGLQKMRATLRAYDPALAPPDKAEEYTWDIPEGQQEDPGFSSRWKNAFHKAGMTPAQVQEVMGEWWRFQSDMANIRAAQDERSRVDGMKQLQAAFGARTDDQLIQATAALGHVRKGYFTGVDEGQHITDSLNAAFLPDGSRLMNDPIVVAGLAMIEEKLFEGLYHDGDIVLAGRGRVEEARTEFKELQEKRIAGQPYDQARHRALRQQLAAIRDREQQDGRRVG